MTETTGSTIHRRDGSMLFHSPTATTAAQAVPELVAEARRNLSYADLSSADLRDADLRYADLSLANLRSADLSYADLRDADLRYANLRYADLSSANLRYADLSYADLSYADLSSADLRDADLRYADLSLANLSSADLRGADLRYADLRDADLRYADLSSANLRYARNVPQVLTVGPLDGWLLNLTNTPDGWRFTAGCRYFTEETARAHWAVASRWSTGSAPEHGARMLAGVDALIALAKASEWPENLVVEEEDIQS